MAVPEALSQIKALSPYVPGLSIAEITDKYGLDQIIKLASNENPLGTPPLAREAIAREAARSFRYPQSGNPRLARALGKWHNVAEARIALGNGSDEIIDLLIRILCQPGLHNIVCCQPCFSIYPIQAKIAAIETRRVPLEKDFSFNFQKLLAAADENTRLVFLTTPDNPTGYCPTAREMESFATRLAKAAPSALLAIDEAYMDFAEDEQERSLLAKGILPENTAFIRTFSKSFGLAGLRIGYAILPQAICDCFWRARLPFSLNLLAEEAALAAMADAPFREAVMATVQSGKSQLTNGLRALGCQVWPSAANFLLFKLPQNSLSAQSCFEKLLAKGLIIRPLASYNLPDHLRISVGTKKENQIFLQALEDILTKTGAADA